MPQELTTDAFETVWATVTLQPRAVRQAAEPGLSSRRCCKDAVAVGQEGRQDHDAVRRHEAAGADRQGARRTSRTILFLDEPTAGVDVELRKDMWEVVRALRDAGVTIILTTHYIEEAEEMADRVGVINKGEMILVEDKAELMRKLGKKQSDAPAASKLDAIPPALAGSTSTLGDDGHELVYNYDTQAERTGIATLLDELSKRRRAHSATCRPTQTRSRTFSSAW